MSVDEDVAAIKQTAADMLAATNQPGRAGAEGYASFMLPDGRLMPPEAPIVLGREAIADFVVGFTEMSDYRFGWEHPDVTVSASGDMAYSIGTYNGGGEDPEGNLIEFEGKLLHIWHRQPDDSWRTAVAVWNTDAPMTGR